MDRAAGSSALLRPLPNDRLDGADSGVDAWVSPKLWDVLVEERGWRRKADSRKGDTMAVVVLRKDRKGKRKAGMAEAQSPVVWAKKASWGSSSTVYAPETLQRLLDPSEALARTVEHILVRQVEPFALGSVILSASSSTLFRDAEASPSLVRERLSKSSHILRQGETLRLDLDDRPEGDDEVRVVMTEPTLQGVFDPSRTQLLVLPPSHPDLAGEEPPVLPPLDDDDDIDINEDFLAATVIDESWRDDETFHPSGLPNGRLVNGINGHASKPKQLHLSGARVDLLPLSRPSSDLRPASEAQASVDGSADCFMSSSDCAKLGLFSGDWAVCEKADGGTQRLVRIFAHDDLGGGPENAESPRMSASPVLLFNLGFPPSTDPSAKATVLLRPAHVPANGPTFPVAEAVTVSRVASPIATNKVYQSLFLRGLRDHFEGARRCVMAGDLVAIGIAEGEARWGEGKSSTNDQDNEPDLSGLGGAPSTAVFFKIASLETGNLAQDAGPAVQDRIAAGQLGAVIDPSATKLIQTGVDHCAVPDVAGWLGLENGAPAFGSHDDPTTPFSRLLSYTAATLRPAARDFDLHSTVLLVGARGSGKRTLARAAARHAGLHYFAVNCYELLGETDVKTEATLRARFERGAASTPCVLLLENVEALARKSQAVETGQEPATTATLAECFAEARKAWRTTGYPLIVIGTTTDADTLPTSVLGMFKEEIKIEAPGEAERHDMLRNITVNDLIAPDVSLRALAVQTAALVAGDLVDLVARARRLAVERVMGGTSAGEVEVADVQAAGVALVGADFNVALEKARSSYSESIGAPKIPNVTWDDVGGLANVKSEILDTIQLPLEHPELFADGLKKRSGILLYGPPGTGKTLLAKAVATSCSLNFFSVKGPELLNMYIGESEANVRRVFQRARDAKPCVIFFDELDSVAPKRGNQGDSGGVMDRIVSQLLAELDGMADGSAGADVFVIGATNRPDLLDPALLRPGRFDRMLYLGISDTHEAQLRIIQALTRKFKLDPSIDLSVVAGKCLFNYTGADFYALCSDAMLKAMTRTAEAVDAKIAGLNSHPPYSTGEAPRLTPQYYLSELATAEDVEVLVDQGDFDRALAELTPSVSVSELDHYKTVQARFSSQTMNSAASAGNKKGKGKAVEDGGLPNGSWVGQKVDVAPVPPLIGKGKGKAREADAL